VSVEGLVAVETSCVTLRHRLLRARSTPRTGLVYGPLVLLALAGCGTGGQATSSHQTILHVTERDFRIAAPKRSHSGEVVLSVHNRGPDAHELIVVRERSSGLPLRRDGSTVSEEKLEPIIAGALEPGSPGSVRKLRLHLAPGRYQLFCNMSGHYLGGMHTVLVVG
jgi:uncharacterized cupredoxin-like copper-binding protein